MLALNYPPPVTLAIYENVSPSELRGTLRAVFGGCTSIQLRFTKLSHFKRPQLVFWAAPEPSKSLRDAHAAIHGLIDPSLCREHYRPGAWVPHCTLATQVSDSNRREALGLAEEQIEPFDVVFDQADLVEFMPVRVLERCALHV